MPILTLTWGQLQQLKRDPLYYNLNIYKAKDKYEVECDGATAKLIKKMVDT